MCDFSFTTSNLGLPRVGDRLMTCHFNTGFPGFAAPEGCTRNGTRYR